MTINKDELLTVTAEIVVAHVGNNTVAVGDLPALISGVYQALATLGEPVAAEPELVPAVSIRASIKPDYLVCLEDGRKLKTLKRHLAGLGLTPDEYRRKWGLPADYPMIAPSYSEKRRQLAKRLGLGTARNRGTRLAA